MSRVKIGVVGAGHLGRFHALNYRELPDVDLVGVYDVNPDRGKQVAEEAGCQFFDKASALLEQVQAVSVAVPTDYHYQVAAPILMQGVHCLIEKPIAQNVDEARELIELAEKSNAILQVGHIERFSPAMDAIQNLVLNPKFIEGHRLAPFNPRGTEVAVILDLMIHDIDVVLGVVDSPVAHIDASGVAVVSETVDIANARIRFENGCVANLTASRISQKMMRKMRLFQKDAYISIDFNKKYSEIYELEGNPDKVDMVLGEIGIGENAKKVTYYKPPVEEKNALREELKEFVQAVQGKPSRGVTGIEGRDALDVAMRILDLIQATV